MRGFSIRGDGIVINDGCLMSPLLSLLRPVISFLGSLSLCACVFAFPALVVSSLVNAGHRYWSHLDSVLCISNLWW